VVIININKKLLLSITLVSGLGTLFVVKSNNQITLTKETWNEVVDEIHKFENLIEMIKKNKTRVSERAAKKMNNLAREVFDELSKDLGSLTLVGSGSKFIKALKEQIFKNSTSTPNFRYQLRLKLNNIMARIRLENEKHDKYGYIFNLVKIVY